MSNIHDIEARAKTLSEARDELKGRLQALIDEQNSAKRRRLIGIRNSLRRVQEAYAELKDAVTESPGLFIKPKTRMLHGLKVGYVKQPGKLEIEDNEAVVKAIKRLFPDAVDTLIKSTEAPVKAALSNLPAKDLKRLGVAVSDDTDKVIIKAADSEVDKMIDALAGDPELEEMV